MSFTQEAGYLPKSFEDIMSVVRAGINEEFGTSYTEANFIGTGWYRYFYSLVQELQRSETKTSEIFSKIQEYITLVNAQISRPLVTNPGLLDEFTRNGFVISIKPPIVGDRGILSVCVDVDDGAENYAAMKLNIANILKESVAGGIVTAGGETETLTLTNGQAFDYKFTLPERIDVWLRLTLTISEHNQVIIPAPEATRLKLFNQVLARYRVGLNFEPQKYFTPEDAPWASQVLLEWSDDEGAGWNSTIFEADFDEKFEIDLANVSLVEV